MLRHFIVVLLALSTAYAQAQEETSILDKWAGPFQSSTSRNILYSGAGIATLLYVNRTQIGDPLQAEWSESEPMGELADFGDIMGQLVPNILYIGGMHLYRDEGNNRQRRNLMFDTTLYTGLTVTILKHLVGEERPDGSNDLSFPSGHTSTAFAFAAVVGIEHDLKWSIPAYTLATIVGASRINDDAHYLHDVVFGATLGISYAYGLKGLQDSGVKTGFIPMSGGGYFSLVKSF